MFLYLKALHIIFVVTWFAGLFYIVRLFVYHSEAEGKPEPEKSILQNQYKIMERRLWYGITWPSMIATLIFGSWMVIEMPALLSQAYFIVKLFFVAGLVYYHLHCHTMFLNYQNNRIKYSSLKQRVWNEFATLFLVSIVFIIVLKSSTNFIYGLLGLIILSIAIFAAIHIYKKNRESNKGQKN